MDYPVLSSTLLFTIFSLIGLAFFIKASVKDRTQQLATWVNDSDEQFLEQLKAHFTERAYRIVHVDPQQQAIDFEGHVQPSLFLAIFLSLLAALGLLCFALVLSILVPQANGLFFFLLWLAPLAGNFYWQKAGRDETIKVAVNNAQTSDAEIEEKAQAQNQLKVVITGHRDELRNLVAQMPRQWLGRAFH